MATFQLFSGPGTGDIPTGPDPENRVGKQVIGSPGRPVSSGLQMPGEPGAFSFKNKTPWSTFRGVCLSKVLKLHQQR